MSSSGETPFYSEAQRELQDRFESQPLAERMRDTIVSTEITSPAHREFIEGCDFFFLSTVNDAGEPTVSYKGGDRGVVTVVDDATLAFPFYDGNGMFLSAGNIAETTKVGLLFIDFERPNRLRVQGTATISADDELMATYPGAILIARVAISSVFVNCARLVHRHQRVDNSPYVPDAEGATPFPTWKRLELFADVLRPQDQERLADAGAIEFQEYVDRLESGDS